MCPIPKKSCITSWLESKQNWKVYITSYVQLYDIEEHIAISNLLGARRHKEISYGSHTSMLVGFNS